MNEDLFEKICQEIEESWEGLSVICPRHKVARSSFYVFKDAKKERLDRYARAREMQMDFLEDLIFKVSMDEKKDYKVDGVVNLGNNTISRARLQVDTIKFVLGKLRSHKWGDKLSLEVNQEPRIFKLD